MLALVLSSVVHIRPTTPIPRQMLQRGKPVQHRLRTTLQYHYLHESCSFQEKSNRPLLCFWCNASTS